MNLTECVKDYDCFSKWMVKQFPNISAIQLVIDLMYQYNQWCCDTGKYDLWIKEAKYKRGLNGLYSFDFTTRDKSVTFFLTLFRDDYDRMILNYGMYYEYKTNQYCSYTTAISVDKHDVDIVVGHNSKDLFGHKKQ